MAIHITGDAAADQVLTDDPFALLVGHDARPAVPDGARVPRAGEGAGAVRHARARADRGGRPRGVRRAVRDPAGHPPVPGLDGRAAAGAGRAGRGEVRRPTPSGSGPRRPPARSCWPGCMALPGFGKQKAQIFVALLAKQLGVRPEGWEAAVGAYAEDGLPLGRRRGRRRRRCRRCATSRRRRRPAAKAGGRRGTLTRPGRMPDHQPGRGRMATAALDVTGPRRAPMVCLPVDERCSCPRTRARCFLPRCCRTLPSSALIERGAPTGSLTPEEVRQASEDAQVEPRHLKALLGHLSALGISVARRARAAAAPWPPPRPARPHREDRQEGAGEDRRDGDQDRHRGAGEEGGPGQEGDREDGRQEGRRPGSPRSSTPPR